MGGAGVSNTSAIAFGSGEPPPGTGHVETWNGTVWINVQDMNSGVYGNSGNGTSTAAISSGGLQPPGSAVAQTEEWYGDGKLTETFTTS